MLKRFQAIGTTLTVAGLAIGTAFSVPNVADAQRVVTCESQDYRVESCSMNTTGGVRLVRQLSNKSCEGNWGYGRNRVWVRNGCRAEFVSRFRRY